MQLYLGDCLEVMGQLGSDSIDLILVDPPYGTTPLKWDKIIDFDKMWEHYWHILKTNGVVLIFGQEPFSTMVRMSNIKNYRYDWYWVKERLTNVFQVKHRPGKIVENIMTFYKNQPKYYPQKSKYFGKKVTNKVSNDARFSITQSATTNVKPLEYKDDGTRYPNQVIYANRDNSHKLLHPTQKPVTLLEYLIRTYTDSGDIVLDSCMGSGSTGIACLNTNRNFIGIEKDDVYFKIAKERIEHHIVPKRLF